MIILEWGGLGTKLVKFLYSLSPDDKSRVKLHEIPGVIGSDYINGNFIDVSAL